ncbi:hypothetical protein MKW98_019963 [Papaver atlanticum]|uniref:Uncharacterized protein n=1 Tax=Papaver atlanticum TaxID=357466 RepID=A0AAD4S1G7_9MAGN|nr:hypothetical protein MKW98_019963 [Papaver atlanticum]
MSAAIREWESDPLFSAAEVVQDSADRRILRELKDFCGRKVLSYSSSSTAVVDESSSSAPVDQDDVHMTENCIQRSKELHAKQAKDKMLRLSVEAGGCFGFQYILELDVEPKPNDKVFTKGVKLAVDKISYGLVKGATVDYL